MIIWSIKIATLLIRTINKTTRRAEFQESNIERYLNAITLSILFVLDNIRVAFIYITSHPSLILHVFITSKQKKINNNKRIIKINFYDLYMKITYIFILILFLSYLISYHSSYLSCSSSFVWILEVIFILVCLYYNLDLGDIYPIFCIIMTKIKNKIVESFISYLLILSILSTYFTFNCKCTHSMLLLAHLVRKTKAQKKKNQEKWYNKHKR